jgi:hypothetical protein
MKPPVDDDRSANDSKLADLIEERYARLPIDTIRRELHRDQIDVNGTLLAVDAILGGRGRRLPSRRTNTLLKIGQIAAAGVAVAFFISLRQFQETFKDPLTVSMEITRGQPKGTRHPLILARAGSDPDPDLAPPDTTGGSAWLLAASELELGEANGATKPAERTTVDSATNLAVLAACSSGASTTRGLVAARWHPGSGRIVRFSLAHIDTPSTNWDRPFTGRQLVGSWAAAGPNVPSAGGADVTAKGSPVRAIADGVISFVGEVPKGGKCIWLTTENGDAFYYMHLDRWSANVYEGMEVRKGDLLAYAEAHQAAQLPKSMLHLAAHGIVDLVPNRFPEVCDVGTNRQTSADTSLPWDQQIRSQ